MEPTRDGDAVVDLLDVILRDGVILQADVIVTVADVPLVGISLRAAIAGMATMTDYGYFEAWDDEARRRVIPDEDGRTERPSATPDDDHRRER
ncbi:gas vesicle protein GvpM [Haloarcula nitratireducens]|uniref:Gas vesicle protein n=1 Tax=Haloarcula nitratireducens TaxID=2487749 RepID=A0AAW4PEA6_9EURY|nr:gas vesicle protein [Halomicroarcula nitratireducens]MBX0296209.1 gas vesicle protein [Halomicroarcula nitratireducens]